MKIEFESVSIQGLGPFRGRVDYPLSKRGAVMLRGINHDDPGSDSNGAGKTTLLMSPLWILTGESDPRPVGSSKKGLTKGLVNDVAGQAEGTLVMRVDGVELKITRRMGKGGHKLEVELDGVDRTEQDTALTQKVVDAIVPTSLLRYIIFFSQHDVDNLLDLTDKTRKGLLGQVINLEIWEKAAKIASAELKKAEAEATRVEGMIEGQKLSAEKAKEGLAGAKKDHEKWQEDHKRELRELSAKPALCGDGAFDISNLTDSDIDRLTGWIKAGAEVHTMAYNDGLGELRLQAKEVEHRIKHQRGQLSGLAEDGKRIKAHGQKLATSQGVWACSECGQNVYLSGEELQRRLNAAKADLDSVRQAWRGVSAEIKDLEARFKTLRAQISEAEKNADKSRQEHTQRVKDAQELASTARDVLDRGRFYLQVSKKRSPFLASIKAFEQMLQDAADHGDLRERIDAANEAASHYKQLATSFGRSGIQSFVMEGAIGDLGQRVASYLNDLSDGYLVLSVKGQTKLKDGDMREKISFEFAVRQSDGAYAIRTYRQLSGGQRRRCKVAMALAFAEFAMDRTGITTNMVVLDEILGHVDAAGKTRARDLALNLNRDSVFVISHDAELGGQFDSVDLVEMKNDQSTVKHAE